MKKTIKMNERELHRLISESVNRLLNEWDGIVSSGDEEDIITKKSDGRFIKQPDGVYRDCDGVDREGYDQFGYNKFGFNRKGIHKTGYSKKQYNQIIKDKLLRPSLELKRDATSYAKIIEDIINKELDVNPYSYLKSINGRLKILNACLNGLIYNIKKGDFHDDIYIGYKRIYEQKLHTIINKSVKRVLNETYYDEFGYDNNGFNSKGIHKTGYNRGEHANVMDKLLYKHSKAFMKSLWDYKALLEDLSETMEIDIHHNDKWTDSWGTYTSNIYEITKELVHDIDSYSYFYHSEARKSGYYN